MSFVVVGGGASKWSQITIDTDKDMGGYGMHNVSKVAAGMVGGDVVVKGLGGVLVRIPAGIASQMLTSQGIGAIPTWAPGGLYLNRYFPIGIFLTSLLGIQSVDHDVAKAAPLSCIYVNTIGDLPTSGVKMETPTVSLVMVNDITPIDQAVTKTPTIFNHIDLGLVVDAAVRDFSGVQTTETSAAKSATINDMSLMQTLPVVGDAYYFGSYYIWDYLILIQNTVGVGNWTITWEYYDTDTTWHALSDVVDLTLGFKPATSGAYTVSFTRPAGWATTNINAAGNMYWIRARVSGFVAITVKPLGTQAWSYITQ